MTHPRIVNIPGASVDDDRLTATAHKVLRRLCMGDSGNWQVINQEELGTLIGFSRAAVNRAMSLLDKHGYLDKRQAHVFGRGRNVLEYRVNFDGEGRELETAKEIPVVTLASQRETPLCQEHHNGNAVVTLASQPQPETILTEAPLCAERHNGIGEAGETVSPPSSSPLTLSLITTPPSSSGTPRENFGLDAEPPASKPAKRQRAKAASVASFIDPDWTPSAEDLAYATEHGFFNGTCAAMAEDFRDYWGAAGGQRARKRSWSLTWKRWVRTQAERRDAKNGRGYDQRTSHGGRAASSDRHGMAGASASARNRPRSRSRSDAALRYDDHFEGQDRAGEAPDARGLPLIAHVIS